MFILYKKENDNYKYVDVWINEEDPNLGYEHTGILGTVGKTETINFKDANINSETWLTKKEKTYRDDGYCDISEEELNVVVIQFLVPSELVKKVEEADDNERERLLSEIDNQAEYDKLCIQLTTLSYDNGFFPGFDGFDLGYNEFEKPVMNIYLYGLDGKKYSNLILNCLIDNLKIEPQTFTIAYNLAINEDLDDEYIVINGNSKNFAL